MSFKVRLSFSHCNFVYSSDVPGPPRDLATTSVAESEIGFKWDVPADNGGTDITGYVIEQREGFGFAFSSIGSSDDTKFTAKRLREGQQYVFRVAAENEVGVGEFVEMEEPVLAKSPHGKQWK